MGLIGVSHLLACPADSCGCTKVTRAPNIAQKLLINSRGAATPPSTPHLYSSAECLQALGCTQGRTPLHHTFAAILLAVVSQCIPQLQHVLHCNAFPTRNAFPSRSVFSSCNAYPSCNALPNCRDPSPGSAPHPQGLPMLLPPQGWVKVRGP